MVVVSLSTGLVCLRHEDIYNNGDLSSITPFVHNGTYQYGTPGIITIVQPDHEVTNGISNFFQLANTLNMNIY